MGESGQEGQGGEEHSSGCYAVGRTGQERVGGGGGGGGAGGRKG